MGRRGPPKQPTAQLATRGSWRAGDRADVDVRVCDSLPACPPHLDGHGAEAWNRYGPILVHQGVVTDGDMLALAVLCEVYQEYMEAVEAVRIGGAYTMVETTTDDGVSAYLIESAASVVRRKARADLMRWLAQFGLSPATRPDVPRLAKPAANALDRFRPPPIPEPPATEPGQ